MTRDKDPLAGTADRRLPILAGVAALCAVLLALSTNVASSLVSQEWAKHHAVWVWAATGVLALASVCLATLASRHGAPSDQTQIAGSLRVGTAAHVEVVSRGAKVDRSVHVTESSGPVVIAEPGSSVSIGSSVAQPPPEHQPGQIVVGELPGAPPAFVQREAVNRLAEAFAAAARVAVVSALTGQRGAGKTQVAAAYARQAVVDGVELVAWVSAEDLSRLRAGLAEVAHRLAVADPEGDSEKSATRRECPTFCV